MDLKGGFILPIYPSHRIAVKVKTPSFLGLIRERFECGSFASFPQGLGLDCTSMVFEDDHERFARLLR